VPLLRTKRITILVVLLSLVILLIAFYFVRRSSHYAGLKPYPNIVLVTIDTLRADHLSSYGYRDNTTSNIDKLAAEGVLFETALAPGPVTLPSHASILTGRYQFKHGVRSNGYTLDDKVTTLAEILKHYRYNTAAFVGSYVLNSRTNINQGFDDFDDDFAHMGTPEHAELYDYFVLPSNAEGTARTARQTNTRVFEWLEQISHTDTPYFLWVHYWDPHAPYDPPFPHRKPGSTKVQLYDAEITFVDDSVGALIRTISSLRLDKNTIYVITADHGEGLGEHDSWDHGLNLYEPVLKVPLIIRYDKHLPRGKRIAGVAASVDIVPTLLKLAGIRENMNVDGIDLFSEALSTRRIIYFDTMWPPEEKERWIGMRMDDMKYTISSRGRAEIYDLHKDPDEIMDLNRGALDGEDGGPCSNPSGKAEYVRLDSTGSTTRLYLPGVQSDMMKAILLFTDIDAWGTGSKGSPTDIGIQVNNNEWVFQKPRKSKLLDGPRRNAIGLPPTYFRQGANAIVVRDSLSQFESLSINGRMSATLSVTYRGNRRVDIDLACPGRRLGSPLSIRDRETLAEKLGSTLLNFLSGPTARRDVGKARIANDQETITKLRGLGYIR
jgi:arylsulfatase A-like enzyme